jgi:hypothetical protein
MAAAFEEHPQLARVAVDPFMPVKSKTAIMRTLLADSGATEITKRLFGAAAVATGAAGGAASARACSCGRRCASRLEQ